MLKAENTRTPLSSIYLTADLISQDMDWDDEEAPPELIETSSMAEREAEEKLIKVPITIVTGPSACTPFLENMMLTAGTH
jgi:hypothetical protein